MQQRYCNSMPIKGLFNLYVTIAAICRQEQIESFVSAVNKNPLIKIHYLSLLSTSM